MGGKKKNRGAEGRLLRPICVCRRERGYAHGATATVLRDEKIECRKTQGNPATPNMEMKV